MTMPPHRLHCGKPARSALRLPHGLHDLHHRRRSRPAEDRLGGRHHQRERAGFVAAEVRAPLEGELAGRLAALHAGLTEVAPSPRTRPDEHTFVNRDAAATLLGQARGIALLVPARGLTVAEYAPNAVKKAIVGVGHAEKAQIRRWSACPAARGFRHGRRRRRACHRHLPRPSPAEHGGAAQGL